LKRRDLSPTTTGQEEAELHGLLLDKLATVIDSVNVPSWFKNLETCGKSIGHIECNDCDHTHTLTYACNQKYCPRCNWKITAQRQKTIGLWAQQIRNPMHLILTQRNFADLDASHFKRNTKNLAAVRRQEVFEHVKGGCVSVELTNSPTEHWHLHSHWLVDAKFVSMKQLAISWGKLVGQQFGIVQFRKLKNKSYVNEVCKYVCKPAEFVTWTALEILTFIKSARGRRFCFTFGNLFRDGAAIREFVKQANARPKAKCRSCNSERIEIRTSSTSKKFWARQAIKRCGQWE